MGEFKVRDSVSGTILLEESPSRQWISYGSVYTRPQYNNEPDGVARFELPMPWRYYMVSAYNPYNTGGSIAASIGYILCSPKRVESWSDPLYLTGLPSFIENCRPCGGGAAISANHVENKLQAFSQLFSAFWGTRFNEGHTPSECLPQLQAISDAPTLNGTGWYKIFADWEKLSVEDVLKIPYVKFSKMIPFSRNTFVDVPLEEFYSKGS